MPELTGYHYAPLPLDRKAAKAAPHAYAMRQQPAKGIQAGRVPTAGSDVSGGKMNGGGKRRPEKKHDSRID